MKKSAARMVIVFLALTANGNAKAADAPATAPSAINEIEQLNKPLAGTLFFDPIQRARMDRMRKHPVALSGGDGEGDGVFPAPTSSVVNGFVKRSDGQSVVWVDGEPRYNVQSANLIRLQPTDVGGEGKSVLLNSSIETSKTTAPAKLRAKKLPVKKTVRARAAKRR